MLDVAQKIIYVGKATNLKKRVSSYFNASNVVGKTRALMLLVVDIKVTVTRSETEALLLERRLIQDLQPKYNILMRDDKSYPFIRISKHQFPSMELVRCKTRSKHDDYFGPYPSVTAVRETIHLIQKIFKLRNCRDSYFNARTRPCLQYQINRCSAPCTKFITEQEYLQSVHDAKKFLQGKSQQILAELAARMEACVRDLAFEEAAVLRDQIKSLRQIQEQQVMVQACGDVDLIVIHAQPGYACVQLVVVRHGEVLAQKHYFPSVPQSGFAEEDVSLWAQVFEAFITHHYLAHGAEIPAAIVTDNPVESSAVLEAALSDARGAKCVIQTRTRGTNARWLDFARDNLQRAVFEDKLSTTKIQERFNELESALKLDHHIKTLACFDISHTQGAATVASCVYFDEKGPAKRNYRLYNITGITPGDDYAAMEQVLTRHFKRCKNGLALLPDLLIIDGGSGQVQRAINVLSMLDITNIKIIGIAKGPTRKAGLERLIFADNTKELTLPMDSKALHLLQHIRDESHRFAITAHRKKRQKNQMESSVLEIDGIGEKRRQALLRWFGGLRELAKAPLEELVKVDGISKAMALRIYSHFHPE